MAARKQAKKKTAPKAQKKPAAKAKKPADAKSKKPAAKKPKAAGAKKAKKPAKKARPKKPADGMFDSGIVIVDDDIEIDRERVNEERRAYLEEARSQDASD